MKVLLVFVIGLCCVNALSDHEREEVLGDLIQELREFGATDDVDQDIEERMRLAQVEQAVLEPADEKQKEEDAQISRIKMEETSSYEKLFPIKLPTKTCCVPGNVHFDTTTGQEFNTLKEVVTGQIRESEGKKKCYLQALYKIDFEQLSKIQCTSCSNCQKCGRQMLKIELELDENYKNRLGYMFNLGNSKGNNGWGGDDGSKRCDAEIHGFYSSAYAYGSDHCQPRGAQLSSFNYVIRNAVKFVTMYVSHHHITVINDVGYESTVCSRCLFCLDEKFDNSIYLAINSVIKHRKDRTGSGVCSVSMKWECCSTYGCKNKCD